MKVEIPSISEYDEGANFWNGVLCSRPDLFIYSWLIWLRHWNVPINNEVLSYTVLSYGFGNFFKEKYNFIFLKRNITSSQSVWDMPWSASIPLNLGLGGSGLLSSSWHLAILADHLVFLSRWRQPTSSIAHMSENILNTLQNSPSQQKFLKITGHQMSIVLKFRKTYLFWCKSLITVLCSMDFVEWHLGSQSRKFKSEH